MKDGKLTYLYLGNHHVTTMPDSIGSLVGIKILDLSRNKISLLPEEICNLYPNHREINLTNNQICRPYPFCFEYVSHQETDQCKSFDCHENYIKIENNHQSFPAGEIRKHKDYHIVYFNKRPLWLLLRAR